VYGVVTKNGVGVALCGRPQDAKTYREHFGKNGVDIVVFETYETTAFELLAKTVVGCVKRLSVGPSPTKF
jgi:hypothetical protein